jgi:hypothetical protein
MLFRRFFIIACACIILCVPAAAYTIGLPPLPKPPVLPKVPTVPIPDVTQLLNGEAITTSFSDAVTAIPFLNDYSPVLATNLTVVQPDSSGGFNLVSGSYWFNGRSYCLHAGKRASTTGDGYLFAPLKGPRAPIIEDILKNSEAHLDVPQKTVQQLIWAILAHAKISTMSTDLQLAAGKLLTPAEILELNQSALGVIPNDKLQELLAKVPDPVKPVLDAENSLRGMFASNATYQDMERVAVLPPLPETSKSLAPPLRWSYDPRGYFVWYVPHSFPSTTTYVDVPGAVSATTDQLGRVTSLQDRQGNRIEVSYGASPAASFSGDPQTHVYQVQSLRFVWSQAGVHGQENWSDVGSILVGVPKGNGRLEASNGVASVQSDYQSATTLRDQFTGLLRQIGGRTDALPKLIALAEFRRALESAAGTHLDRAYWLNQELNFPVGAWETEIARSVGGKVAANASAGLDDPFAPSSDTAVPQNTDAQRLAQSPTCQNSSGSPSNAQLDVGGALELGGHPQWNVARKIVVSSSGNTEWWALNLDSHGKPVDPCAPNPDYSLQGIVTAGGSGGYNASLALSNGNKLVSVGQGSGSDPIRAIFHAANSIRVAFPL